MELIKTTRTEVATGFCDIKKKPIQVFRLFYKVENQNTEKEFIQVFDLQSCFTYMRIFTLLELKKYLKSQNLPKWK